MHARGRMLTGATAIGCHAMQTSGAAQHVARGTPHPDGPLADAGRRWGCLPRPALCTAAPAWRCCLRPTTARDCCRDIHCRIEDRPRQTATASNSVGRYLRCQTEVVWTADHRRRIPWHSAGSREARASRPEHDKNRVRVCFSSRSSCAVRHHSLHLAVTRSSCRPNSRATSACGKFCNSTCRTRPIEAAGVTTATMSTTSPCYSVALCLISAYTPCSQTTSRHPNHVGSVTAAAKPPVP